MDQVIKLAFFVEGGTEASFLEKLLKAIYNIEEISVEKGKRKFVGGLVNFITLQTDPVSEKTKYYVLIVDCKGENGMASFIKDRRPGLIKAGYVALIGLLDLYPRRLDELYKYEYLLKLHMPQKDIPIKFIISIMEVEAWFISDYAHFLKIDEALSPSFIKEQIGLDIENDNLEAITHPAEVLNKIYELRGLSYEKNAESIQRTIDALDIADLYYTHSKRVPSLQNLVKVIEEFLP